jgi:hypothetical protein
MKGATHRFSSVILGVAVWAFWLRDKRLLLGETLSGPRRARPAKGRSSDA